MQKWSRPIVFSLGLLLLAPPAQPADADDLTSLRKQVQQLQRENAELKAEITKLTNGTNRAATKPGRGPTVFPGMVRRDVDLAMARHPNRVTELPGKSQECEWETRRGKQLTGTTTMLFVAGRLVSIKTTGDDDVNPITAGVPAEDADPMRRIKVGMKYDAVKAIFGEEGKLTQHGASGIAIEETYVWRDEDGHTIAVSFSMGMVTDSIRN